MSDVNTRAGVAAVIGAPNAGKSTLVNRLVGQKVSIVTHKVQTTRFPIRGVMMRGDTQIVLVDTPGIFDPGKRLDRAMVRSAWAGLEGADAVVHLVDAAGWIGAGGERENDLRVIERLKGEGAKVVLALNKIDLVERPKLLEATQQLFDHGVYSDVMMISAGTGDGVEELADFLVGRMPEGPFLFPPEQSSDIPMRLLAAEVTREKLMLRLHQEIPYQLAVETEEWERRRDGSVRIGQLVHVSREGHKRIVLGKRGEAIKAIGSAARAELRELLDCEVHLFLRVRVTERWQEMREMYSSLGLDFDA